MSAQYSHPVLSPVPGHGVATTGRRAFAGIGKAVRGYYDRYRSRQLLAQLDDRLLRDIGLTRAEAMIESRRSFWS